MALEALEYGHFAVADQAPHAGVMTYLEATDNLREALAKPERQPLTDKDLEPLKIRLMSAAYDAADDGQSETYNDIKVLCGVLLDLVKRAVTSLDNTNLKEDQLDYIAQQIKNVAGGVRKPLTDDEIRKLWDSHTIEVYGKIGINPVLFARYLEREYGIGEKE